MFGVENSTHLVSQFASGIANGSGGGGDISWAVISQFFSVIFTMMIMVLLAVVTV